MRGMNLHKKPFNTPQGIALAACRFAVCVDSEIQLLPAGAFRAADDSGRPEHAQAWVVNAEIAAKLVAQIAARANPLVVDYEHQTFLCADNGQPAIAAGWIIAARWEEPSDTSEGGLFATVEWTARAKQHITDNEYKFISPVFHHEKTTGVITKIVNAALTNNPAIDGMEAVSARLTAQLNQPKENTMDLDELLERVRYLLNLPTLTTPEQVAVELQKAVDLIKAGETDAVVSATALGVVGMALAGKVEIALLKAAKPNPTEYVPVATFDAVKSELVTLRATQLAGEVEGVLQAALTANRIQPHEVEWLRSVGKQDIALLKQRVATAPVLAALAGTQTGGVAPVGNAPDALSDAELAMCRQFGVSADEFKKTRAAGMVA